MVTKYLYKNFLDDKRTYNLNRAYWKSFFSKITKGVAKPYNETFSNGTLFYDGNPIASAFIPALGKSVRIVQEEIETESVEIGAWTEETELDNQQVNELVISLELSKEAADIAKTMIMGWLMQDWDKNRIDLELEKAITLDIN